MITLTDKTAPEEVAGSVATQLPKRIGFPRGSGQLQGPSQPDGSGDGSVHKGLHGIKLERLQEGRGAGGIPAQMPSGEGIQGCFKRGNKKRRCTCRRLMHPRKVPYGRRAGKARLKIGRADHGFLKASGHPVRRAEAILKDCP